jgi:hypothetical protein
MPREESFSIPLPQAPRETVNSSPPFTHKTFPKMANNGAASVPLINREDFEETERPASAQRVNPPTNDNLNIGEEEYLEPEEEDSDDPADKLAEFNWDDLHARYHQVINQATDEETELMDEWSHLMGVLHPFISPSLESLD